MKIADFLQFRKDCSDDRKLTDEDIIEAFDKLEDLIKPNEPPQRAEGVPEWFRVLLSSNEWTDGEKWKQVEAEIAHRVAEDRRDALCYCQKKLKEARAERDAALTEVEKFKTSAVGTLVADAIRADRESDERECRREIRRLRAEVERLKARQLPDSWEMSVTLRYAEVASKALEQKERADKAEAELAELRELVRTHYLMWTTADASTEWSFLKRMKFCPDADLDAALAEFRKHKEPTQ